MGLATATPQNGHHDTATIAEIERAAPAKVVWVCVVRGRAQGDVVNGCVGGGPGTKAKAKEGIPVEIGVKPSHREAGCGWYGNAAL